MRSIWKMAFAVGLLAPAWITASAEDVADEVAVSAPDPQALKLQALGLAAEARVRVEDGIAPKDERLDIYFGQTGPGLRAQGLSVVLDHGQILRLELAPDAATALSSGRLLHRVARLRVAPGTHRLRASVLASALKAEDGPGQHDLDLAFEKGPGELALVIRLQEPGLMAASSLALEHWRPGASAPGWATRALGKLSNRDAERRYRAASADDPALRHARYLLATGDAEGAVIELQALKSASAALPADYWLALAEADRRAGLPDDAVRICSLLDAQKADRGAVALQRLHLAEDAYDRGDLAQAESLLLQARPAIPEPSAADWRLAQASLLLAQEKPAAAAALLKQTDAPALAAFRFMSQGVDALRAAAYRQFNLAVALVQHGDEKLGLSWLDLVGRLKNTDEQLLALRDRANLTLGWHFLRQKQGATAIGILGRIRSEGPFSNAALVGIGWAQLEPAGNSARRQRLDEGTVASPELGAPLPSAMTRSLMQLGVLEPELFGEHGPRRFTREKPPADRREGLRRAITLWSLLKGRDPGDPSVQEALLAIAYAYDQLDDFAESRKAYAEAIATLQSVHDGLRGTAAAIGDGALGPMLDQAADSAQVFDIMARHGLAPDAATQPLYATVARYRDLARTRALLLAQQLPAPATPPADSAAPPLDPAASLGGDWTRSLRTESAPDFPERVQALAGSLEAQRVADAARIQQLALAQLERRQRTFKEYLKAAYFSAARIEDRRLAAETGGTTTSASIEPAP